ncbi:MAG: hypothetical protein CMM78_04225 [Rhodospirillaceae bacterium]|uniref:helix-turn-helix domain-containing protein n=1 Tax=Hwanghaeella sp. LZ110 TaxID=3402810 RepID=UPI000C5A9DC3|nr:hypothetical protein [Rhodospirillales bacterium]MAX47394.1 hypothetical protein [Rhodospirillaceae bacterium]MDF1748373.1 helix-turn-helix domain-containing protein [Alphaproteobacteria bacterium]
MSNQPSLVSVRDAAHRLGIGRTRFYELLNCGEIESVHLGSRRLILCSSIDQFIERLRQHGEV